VQRQHARSQPPSFIRLPVVLCACLVASIALAVGTAAPARADSSAGQFVADTNSSRASDGLSGYAVSSDLTSIAQSHAASMARSRSIYHNSSLGSDVCCWQSIGENVGDGPSVSSIENAFMNSSSHRGNILSSSFTQIGVGTARDSSGQIYVDEVFRQPTGSSGSHHVSVSHSVSHSSYSPPHHTYSPVLRRVTAAAVRPPNLIALLANRLHRAAVVARGHPRDPLAAAYGFARVMTQIAR
jgi:Cysteine-rich secretory protein family